MAHAARWRLILSKQSQTGRYILIFIFYFVNTQTWSVFIFRQNYDWTHFTSVRFADTIRCLDSDELRRFRRISIMLPNFSPVVQTLFGTLFTWGLTAIGSSLILVFSGTQVIMGFKFSCVFPPTRPFDVCNVYYLNWWLMSIAEKAAGWELGILEWCDDSCIILVTVGTSNWTRWTGQYLRWWRTVFIHTGASWFCIWRIFRVFIRPIYIALWNGRT